jgi:ribosomal protein L11 methyltransferase
MTGRYWRISLTASDIEGADAAAAALDATLGGASAFDAGEGTWLVEGWSFVPPDRAVLETMLALAWANRTGAPPALAIERVAARDWVAENQASFPPLVVGRYFIHGSHTGGKVLAGRVGLLIDAATAFGTGEHATTRGCLLALEGLARRGRRRRVLDMGTGTGILAIAAAKTWRAPIAARDIDAEAVRVARHNVAVNGVARYVVVRRSAGHGDRWLRRAAPYDLVCANILARPLIAMSRALAAGLASGGVAVLSGLLARHEAPVLAAHRSCGLILVRRIVVAGWHTLVLARGRSALPIATDTMIP